MIANDLLAGGAVSATAKARAERLVGRTIRGKYRVEELVAMGGLAAIFRATQLTKRKQVAIKVLHPDTEELPDLIERFEREAIAGRHIFHPNVAAVYEINQLEDGGWFMVMEYIRGITLKQLIDQGPVHPLRAARIAKQLATALNAAHDFGIVHRDVKPLNVMLLDGIEERVQLIDFGLAKVPVEELTLTTEDSRRSLSQAGVVFGTIAYMAPEAALGMNAVDKRSDLYALGLILYEMLSGKHPFTAKEPIALFAAHRSARVPPIGERTPGVVVPTPLEAVVKRLLEKDPDERFPHARAAIVALDAAIEQIAAKPIINLKKLGVIVAIFILMAFGTVLGWFVSTR